MKNKALAVITAAALCATTQAVADDTLKIGLMTTLTGPGSGLGIDIRDGFMLAVEDLGGSLGGVPTEIVEADDQRNPELAVQTATNLIDRDGIDIMTGQVWSNLALAIMPTLARNEVFFISPNAGPSVLAGKQCNPWFFNAAWQNDNNHEAMGAYVAEQGFENVYLMAPNYPAGHDALAGFKRYYEGNVAGEVFTALGQTDYAAELANLRAAEPDAVYYFYPGGMGINFVKQFDQAGLMKDIPLFAPGFSMDHDILPAVGDAALGVYNSGQWSPDLDNEINLSFMSEFEARHGRLPSLFAAQGYDTALVIDAAIKGAGDAWSDRDAFREALAAVEIETTRGAFRFNSNHFPVQDFYIRQVVKRDDGTLTNVTVKKIFEDHADAYASECNM
jgi:branched-chain amino acid transport system substrate-binding protein